MSVSALARQAGLNPTTFNKSKRVRADGQLHWPSTQSIAKILDYTGITPELLCQLLYTGKLTEPLDRALPRVALDDLTSDNHWASRVMSPRDEPVCVVAVTSDALRPDYKPGDRIVLDLGHDIEEEDTVLVQLTDGSFRTGRLSRKTDQTLDLDSTEPAHLPDPLPSSRIGWSARILWTSP